MTHLSADQLSALVDGALSGRAREDAERHLAGCAPCQEALSGLVAQDRALSHALTHDPGESYFETFPDRVNERIRASSPAITPARLEDSRGLADWFRSPRKLGWLGAVAAVVAGAGIVMMSSREIKRTDLRDAGITDRANQVAVPTPPASTVDGARGAPAPERASERDAGSPSKDRTASRDEAVTAPSSAPSPSPGAMAEQSRLREVRRNAAGEDVPVGREQGPAFATPPPAAQSSPPATGGAVRVRRQRVAQPLAGSANQESAEALAKEEAAKPAEKKESAPSSPQGASSTTAPGAYKMLYSTAPSAAEQQLDASIGASAFETLPVYERSIARNAQRLTAVAERLKAASGYDAAASEWSRLLGHAKGGALEQETRWQIASTRFHAFEAGRNGPRKTRAADALRAFLDGAAPGSRRDEAVRWLDQVNRAK